MGRIQDIGESRKDRLYGGETWTVTWVKPGRDVGLAVGQRLRLEDRLGGKNAYLFPDANSPLHNQGNTEIKLDETKNNPTDGFTYAFNVKLNGSSKALWLKEGSAVPGTEAEIWEANPDQTGTSPGGSAGIRR
jgi:hypothetical protein